MKLSYNSALVRSMYFALPWPLRDVSATLYSALQHRTRFGRDFHEFLKELERGWSRSEDEAAAAQVTRLQSVLSEAATTVPYYRERFGDAGFVSQRQMDSITDLRRLPMLDKETVRMRASELLCAGYSGPIVRTHTSGTTGKALHLQISRAGYQRSQACAWHHLTWFGVRFPARAATLAGHPVAPPDRLKPPFWVTDWFGAERFFSSQHLTDVTLPLYARHLAEFRPDVVRGYPSSLFALATKVVDDGLSTTRPRVVVASSETLLGRQRETIADAFHCPVVGYYSSAERAAHILECEAGWYHVLSDACVVEVVRTDGSVAAPGEEGELVCTGLLDRLMPLVRYRTGDTGILAAGPCKCGRAGQVLSAISGRVEDVILTPDGRRVGRLDHAFKDALNVKEAQLVQDRADRLVVRLVPRPGYGSADERAILAELRLRLGPSIDIIFDTVRAIPREPNGKLKFVISRVGTTPSSVEA